MPATLPNNDLWQPRMLERMAAAVAAQGRQSTQYIVDPTTGGGCVVIIGDISADNRGNPTGLTGWGIASFQVPDPGTWTQTA